MVITWHAVPTLALESHGFVCIVAPSLLGNGFVRIANILLSGNLNGVCVDCLDDEPFLSCSSTEELLEKNSLTLSVGATALDRYSYGDLDTLLDDDSFIAFVTALGLILFIVVGSGSTGCSHS